MPRVRAGEAATPPDGWDLISPPLLEFERKMRAAEAEPHEGRRKCESVWEIFKIHHQRSRYIFELYYKRNAISRETSLADQALRVVGTFPGREHKTRMDVGICVGICVGVCMCG